MNAVLKELEEYYTSWAQRKNMKAIDILQQRTRIMETREQLDFFLMGELSRIQS